MATSSHSTLNDNLIREYRCRAPGLNLLLCDVVDRLRYALGRGGASSYSIEGRLSAPTGTRPSLWSDSDIVGVRIEADDAASLDDLTEIVAREFAVEKVERGTRGLRLVCRWIETSNLVIGLPSDFRFEIAIEASTAVSH